MYYIVIDTSQADQIVFYYTDSQQEGGWYSYKTVFVGDVLSALVLFLEKKGITIQALAGVGVVKAGGSFSASRRIAILVNALAYSLHIPVVECQTFTFQTVQELFGSTQLGNYVLPAYTGEPHVTFSGS